MRNGLRRSGAAADGTEQNNKGRDRVKRKVINLNGVSGGGGAWGNMSSSLATKESLCLNEKSFPLL